MTPQKSLDAFDMTGVRVITSFPSTSFEFVPETPNYGASSYLKYSMRNQIFEMYPTLTLL